MKEAEIRADVGVSFTRQSEPEAQVKLAVVLTDSVAVSRSAGTFVAPGEEAWGLFDQTLTYINMSKMTVDFPPARRMKPRCGWVFLLQRRTS